MDNPFVAKRASSGDDINGAFRPHPSARICGKRDRLGSCFVANPAARPRVLILSNLSSLAADDGKTAPEHRMQKSARIVVSQDVHSELAAARRVPVHRPTRLLSRARARRS
jgi:hypothetical protein